MLTPWRRFSGFAISTHLMLSRVHCNTTTRPRLSSLSRFHFPPKEKVNGGEKVRGIDGRRGGRDATWIKSSAFPTMAEADLSLLIYRWCLWQRFGAYTLTITGNHKQDRTGIGSVEPGCIDSRSNAVISASLSQAAVPIWLPVQ